MTNPSVAVIVPAFRAADVLDTTLASVAGQTRPPEQVVVIDDASGDDTATTARSWSGRLPVSVIELPENLGPAGARRIGIASTSTDRIALLDADDVWLPDHLETMSAALDDHGGIITADALRWVPGRALATRSVEADLPLPPPAEQRTAILRSDFVFVGTLFGRDAYDAAGGFRDQFHGTEDWDLWIRMIRAGATVHRAPHPTVLYRLTTGSVSADARIVHEERKVVDAALEVTFDPDERRALDRTRREIDAKAAMYAAYDAARQGRSWRARRLAVGGLRGPGRVPSRCVALMVLPRLAVAARDRLVHQPRWWLRP